MDLHLSTDKTITSITLETGFENVDYFCCKFKEHYIMTANDYRTSKS